MAAAVGIAVPLLILTGNHSDTSRHVGNLRLTANLERGRELFGAHCAVCHTLSAANAVGEVGPNLNQLKPPESVVIHTINNGCLPNANAKTAAEMCLGEGVMPAQVLQGQEATDVAKFVAAVTGSGTASGTASGTSTSTSSASSAPSASTTASSSSSAAAAPSGVVTKLALATNPHGLLMYDKTKLKAKAGKVEITLTNASPLAHNVTVQKGTSGPSLGATPTFAHGTKTLTLTLTAGTYTYYCAVPGHRQAGMHGTLTVS